MSGNAHWRPRLVAARAGRRQRGRANPIELPCPPPPPLPSNPGGFPGRPSFFRRPSLLCCSGGASTGWAAPCSRVTDGAACACVQPSFAPGGPRRVERERERGVIGLLTVHNRSVAPSRRLGWLAALPSGYGRWLGIGHGMSMTLLSQQLGHGPVLPVVGGFVLYPHCFFSLPPLSPHPSPSATPHRQRAYCCA